MYWTLNDSFTSASCLNRNQSMVLPCLQVAPRHEHPKRTITTSCLPTIVAAQRLPLAIIEQGEVIEARASLGGFCLGAVACSYCLLATWAEHGTQARLVKRMFFSGRMVSWLRLSVHMVNLLPEANCLYAAAMCGICVFGGPCGFSRPCPVLLG